MLDKVDLLGRPVFVAAEDDLLPPVAVPIPVPFVPFTSPVCPSPLSLPICSFSPLLNRTPTLAVPADLPDSALAMVVWDGVACVSVVGAWAAAEYSLIDAITRDEDVALGLLSALEEVGSLVVFVGMTGPSKRGSDPDPG